MRVILLTDVPKLGKKDAVVEVADGYARNYLFKRKQAVKLDEKNQLTLAKQLAMIEANKQRLLEQAIHVRDQLAPKQFVFELRVENEKVFGSVNLKQFLSVLNQQFPHINKGMVQWPSNLSLGTFVVEIKLHKAVLAQVSVIVQPALKK